MKCHTERSPFRVFALVALLTALSGGAWADRTPTAEELAAQAKTEAIAAIGTNRAGTITDLGFQWSSASAALGYPSSAWVVEFAAILQGASNSQLYDIQKAASYDAVRAILQGRSAPVSLDGVAGTASLGDTTNDLTFTPVTPCRILDTRYDTNGLTMPTPGTLNNYIVYGTAAQLAPQGHTAGTGCTSPKGEPVAISANFTVATPTGNGNIKPFPYGPVAPNASFLNYQLNTNLANAGIVATCYICGFDLTIQSNFGATHFLADVMGYFYPAQIGIGVETRQGGYDWFGSGVYLIDATPPAFIGPLTGSTVLSLNGGEEVTMQFSAQAFGNAAGNACGTLHAAYRNTATLVVTNMGSFDGETDFSFASNGSNQDQRSLQVSGRENSMPAGTYEFGITAIKGSSGCGPGVDYSLTSTKFTVTKIRRP